MKRHDKLAETIPVGNLGILALESSKEMGQRVNDYIVNVYILRLLIVNHLAPHGLCQCGFTAARCSAEQYKIPVVNRQVNISNVPCPSLSPMSVSFGG